MSTAADENPTTTGRPELAPSDLRAQTPIVAQTLGFVGLALSAAGAVAVVAAARGGTALVSGGYGSLMLAAGLGLMFLHALRDTELEIRRLYGGLAGLFLAAGVVVSLLSGPAGTGSHFLPWGVTLGALSLAFFVPFTRNETDPGYRRVLRSVLLSAGASFSISSVLAGLIQPDFLVGPGLALALLGTGFIALYLTTVDPAVGVGRQVVVGLGLLALVTVAVAVGRSATPVVLYDGPAALRTPAQTWDTWKVIARGLSVLAALGVASLAFARSAPIWLRSMCAVFGLAFALVLVYGSMARGLTEAPAPFFVPYGLILLTLGVLFGAVSIGTGSESQFVVLARRELTAYFYSPTGYLILFGMAAVSWLAYAAFVYTLRDATLRSAVTDPIMAYYTNFGVIGAFVTVFLVPAVTMGLFAEERRTGTFEVLLTAPVSEATVTLSKFFAAWLFFLVAWMPAGLYLIALRIGGGEPFDYRPVLTFYLALAATGAAFVAIGTFFSSLTRNQVVAAVLTFAVLMGFLLMILLSDSQDLGAGVRVALSQFDFLTLWKSAAQGQLAVQAVVMQLSVAVFFLYLTTKVLEARKWS